MTTKPDGSVAVTTPTAEIMRALTCGGIDAGYFGRVFDRDWEVHKMVAAGCRETLAVRWFRHLTSGGLTDAEAYELIADKDIPADFTAREFVDAFPDRWFRDAWRRGRNGGPIDIDLVCARRIQARRILAKREAAIKSLEEAAKIGLVTGDGSDVHFLSNLEQIKSIDMPELGRCLASAKTSAAVKAIWPAVLDCHDK